MVCSNGLPLYDFAANAASLLLYAAPILTFKRVIRKRSTEEFSGVPYIIALLNCLLYTCIGLVASISMYSSPLVAMKQVIKTKSVEFMPFYLSFFSFFASSLWMTYGFLGKDLFIAAPNLLGSPIGLLQLVLYCLYRKSKEAHTEPNKVDLEMNGAKFTTQLQEVHEKKLEN
ncbi:bidirectional sugar transporter SWEET3b-like [Phoenix dactylifera]|uniref:Bidirectional sugar transporter SWEET3b-like n=1 Tax=Phoenix dactylifera TaxID=42345 RepID=A0A8B9AT39_PHODC|nr:bidirectional sugar transporter SWEET3b-like [Phoenix dactylifera]